MRKSPTQDRGCLPDPPWKFHQHRGFEDLRLGSRRDPSHRSTRTTIASGSAVDVPCLEATMSLEHGQPLEFLPKVRITPPDIPPWPGRGLRPPERISPAVGRSAVLGLPAKPKLSASPASNIHQRGRPTSNLTGNSKSLESAVSQRSPAPKSPANRSSPLTTVVMMRPAPRVRLPTDAEVATSLSSMESAVRLPTPGLGHPTGPFANSGKQQRNHRPLAPRLVVGCCGRPAPTLW